MRVLDAGLQKVCLLLLILCHSRLLFAQNVDQKFCDIDEYAR